MRLTSWLSALSNSVIRRNAKAKEQTRRRRSIGGQLEQLEDRTLLTYNVSLDGAGVLTISQADAGDTSTLNFSMAGGVYTFADVGVTFNAATGVNAAQVTVAANQITVANADVTSIVVTLGDGDDAFTFSSFNATGDDLTLDMGGNTGDVVTVSGAYTSDGDVSINNAQAIDINAALTVATNLVLDAGTGDITQTAAISAPGTVSLSGSNITLNQANTFGTVTVGAGTGDVSWTENGAISIGAISHTGNLTLNAGANNITQAGAINIGTGTVGLTGGAITLTQANVLGAVTINSGTGAVSLTENDAISIASLAHAGALTLNAGTNGITQTGVINVGAQAVNLTGGTITLTQANVLGAVTVNAGTGDVSLTENDAMALTSLAHTGNLTLNAGTNAITQTGAVNVGTGTVSLTGGAITLTQANVLGAVTINAGTGAVSLTENDAISIASLTHTGTLTLNAGTNAISQTGDIEITTNALSLTGGTITLANTANTFGAITVASGAGDVSLRQDGAMSVTGITRTSGNLTLNANGAGSDLTQSGAISIATGTANLNAANITLTQANVLGAVTINAGTGNVSLTENGAISLAAVTHTGSLTLNAGTNAITQTGDIEVGTGTVGLTGGTITLANTANTFGAITVASGAGDVSLRQDGAMSVTGITRTSGNLTLNANGSSSDLTQTGAISIATGTANLSAANITLTQANVLGAVTINAGTGDVSLTENNAIAVAGITHTGNLTLSAGTNGITQTGDIEVGTGTLGLTGGTITLANTANTFGAITVASGAGDVSLRQDGAMSIAAITRTSGNLTLNANGATSDLTQTGAISIATGTANLSGANITLTQANVLGVVTVNAGTGNVSLTENGAISLATVAHTGSVTLNAGTNAITQTGVMNVGTGAVTLTGGSITLTQANVLGAITINAGTGDISLTENDALAVAAITHTGNLTLNAGTNAISQTGDVEVGTGTLGLTGGTITLANTTNTFGAITVASGAGDVSLRQDGAMSVAGITRTSGNVTLNANGSNSDLTQTGAISIAAGTANLSAANITLTQANVLGAVTINAGTGNISLTENDAIAVAAITHTGTLALSAGTNAITQTGAINVGTGTTSLTGGTITLTQANVLGAVTVNAGTGAVSLTENDAIAIAALTHTGALTLNAGTNAISQTGDIEVGTGALSLTGGTITLANTANTFGAITVASGAGDVSLRQDGAMSVTGITRTTGNLTLNANGASSDLTQTGAISIATGSANFTGANITLTQSNVLGAVTVNAGTGAVSLTENDAIAIAAITHTGNLTLNAGTNAITQSGVINVGTGTANLTGGSITLTQANVLGAVTVNAGTGDVSLTENDAIALTSLAHTGNLTLSAGTNAITQTGAINVGTGTANLTAGAITLTQANVLGAVTINAGTGDVSLTENDALAIAAITHTGNLTLNAGTNAISQTGDVEVGTGTLALTGGTITLANTANTFGAITVASGAGDVSLRQDGAMSITAITRTSGNLTLNANGGASNVTQSGALAIAAGTLNVTGADITLANASNVFGTAVITAGNNVSLRDETGFDVGASSITGTLTVRSDAAITQSSALGGTASLVKQGTGTLTLNQTNTYSGSTTISAGTVLVTGSTAASSAVAVNSNATLGGTGTVNGAVTVNSLGTITGGTVGGVGTLTVGSLAFNGGTYAVDVNGNTSDTIVTAGTIDLQATAQGTFSLNSQTGSTADNNVFVLINNTHATNAIVDPPLLTALQGASTTVNTKTAVFSYTGGSGANDFTLTTAGTFTYTATAGNDTLTIKKTGTDIQIIDTGSNAVLQSLPTGAVNDIVVNGLDGNDTFAVDFTGGLDKNVTVNGGNPTSGSGDKLIVNNGTFTTGTFNYTNAHDGSITLDSRQISYTGLEPVLINVGSLANAIFNLPAGGNTAFLEDDGTLGNGLIQLRSSPVTFEVTTFTSPTVSLTINGGTGNDDLTISDVDSGTFALTVDLAGGTDSLTQNGALTLGSGTSTGNVSYAAETIAVNAGITNTAGTTGTVTLNASNTLTIAAAGAISANSTVSLTGTGGISTAGSVTTTNDAVTFNSNTTLTGDIAVNTGAGAGTITFSGSLTGTTAGAEDLTLTAGTGDVVFTGTVGGTRLGAVQINSATNVTAAVVTAASFVQSAGTGTTTLNGALNTNTATGVALTTNVINLNASVTTTAGGTVTLTNAGLLTIAAAGDISADGAVTQNGAGTVTTAGDVTTTNDAVSILRAVTLSGPVAINTGAGAGNVSFSSTVDGGQTLGITAGTGSVSFTGAVGGTTALTSVTVASATDVTFSSTVRTTGTVTQTAGTGTTTFNGTSGTGIGGTLNINTSTIVLNTATVTTVGAVTLTAQNAITQNANLDAGAATVTISANQDNAGGEDFTQAATAAITTTNATAAAVSITVGNTGDAFINSITTSTSSPAAVTITVGTGGQIAETADDGAADITTFNLTLIAGAGIGATNGPLEVAVDTLVNANVTGTGAINISDLAGGLNVTSATTNDGAITLNATAGALNLTTVTAGGTANITATTTTSGTISVGNVTALGDTVNLTAAAGGSILELGADAGADVSGGTLNFTVSGAGTVGAGGTTLEIDATTELNVTTAGGSIFLEDTAGGLPVGLVTAGAGNVTLTATGGSLTESATTDAAADIVGATLNLTVTGAASTVGTNAETLEINATTQLNVTTAGGSIFLEDTAGGVAVGLVTAGAGDVNLQATNGSLTSSTVDGTADIVGATLNLVVTGAGSDFGTSVASPLELNATTALNATTPGAAGNDAFIRDTVGTLPLGLVNVGAGTAYLQTTNGSITDTDAGGNDVTAAAVRFEASAGVGTAADPIETTVATLTAISGAGPGVFVSNTGNLSVGTVLTQNGVVTNGQDTIITATGSISLDQPLNAGAGDARLVAGTTVTQAAAGVITANDFGVRAGGNVTLANATPTFNDVDTLAVSTTGLVEFRDSDDLTVTTVTASGAFTATAGVSSGGSDINLRTGTTLAVSNVLNAGAGDIRLVVGNTAGVSVSQAAAGVITADELGIQATGRVGLAAAQSDVNTLAVAANGTIDFIDADDLIVGTVAAGGSALIGFTNTVGISSTGNDVYLETNGAGGTLAINSAITTGAGDLRLEASGAVTQTAAISATGLSLTDTGSFTLTLTTNSVTTLAANTNSTIHYVNAGALIVGAVTVTTVNTTNTTTGITTSNDNVTLKTQAGNITVNNTINLGTPGAGGSLELILNDGTAASVTQAGAANVLAQGLALLSSGAGSYQYTLDNVGNNVANIAADFNTGATAFALRYQDADDLHVNVVTGLTNTTTGITTGNPANGGGVRLRAGQTTPTGILYVDNDINTNNGTFGNLTIGGGVVFTSGNTFNGAGDIDLEGGAASPDIVVDTTTTHNMTGGTVTYRPDRDIFINRPVTVNNGNFVLDADGEDPVVATTIANTTANLGTGNGVGGVWIRDQGAVDVNTGVNGGGALVIAGSQINNTPNGGAAYTSPTALVAGAGVQIDNTSATTEVSAASTIAVLVKTVGAAGNDLQVDGNIVSDASGDINVQVEDTLTLNSTIALTTAGTIYLDAEDMVINTTTAVIDAQPTGVVWLRNRSAGRTIDLGQTGLGQLQLSNAELNRISPASVVRIGRNDGQGAGTLTVSAANINLTQNSTLHLITSASIVDDGTSGDGTITETNLALEAGTGIDLDNVNAVPGVSGNDVDNLSIRVTGIAAGNDATFKDVDDVNFAVIDGTASPNAVNVFSDLTIIAGGAVTQTAPILAGGLELIDLFNDPNPPLTFLAFPTYYLPDSGNQISRLEAYSQRGVNITNSTTLAIDTVANAFRTFPASGASGVWVQSLQLTAPTIIVNSPIETNDELGFVTFDVTTLLDINNNIDSRGKIEQIGTGVVTIADVELRTTDDNITFLGGVTLDGGSLVTPTTLSTDANWTTPFTGIPLAANAAAQTGAGAIIFSSTLRSNPSGDTSAAYRGNDLILETGTGNIQFIGQVGGAAGPAGRLGVVTIVDAHDVTATTGFSANAIYQQAGDGETRFNGFVQTNGRRDVLAPTVGTNYGVDITTKMITLNAGLTTTSAPGSGATGAVRLNNSGTLSIVAGAGSINSDGAVSQVGTGDNLIGGDIVTTNDNISFASDTYLSGTPIQINSGNADVSFAKRFQINNKTVTIRDKDFVDLGTVTAIAGGVLNVFVANTATRGSIQAGSGETITGAGTLNTDVSVLTGGTLAPAMDASGLGTGILTINGNTVLGTNAVYAVDLNGVVAGSSFDQVVTGATFTFNATNAILSANRPVTFNPATGAVLKIIEGSVDVVGNFANATNASYIYINGLYFRADYDVTAGDLTLTRQDPPGAAVFIIDDNGSSPSTPVTGFTLSPNNTTAWSPNSVTGRGYGNDLRFAAAGTGTSTALYTFTGLIAGHTYRVSTTWYPHINRATDSPFTIDDGAGGTAAFSTTLNQRNSPDDFTSAGSAWEDLVAGGYTISGTTLTVLLTNATSTGYVIADAVRIEDITGSAPEIVVLDGTTDIADGTGIVDFGTTSTTGVDITKTISIKNTGLSPLVLSSATITPPPGFSISGYVPQTIAPGATGTPFTITLSHLSAGNFSGQISFNTNDFDENPFNFTIKGGVTSSTTQIADNLSAGGGYNTITGSAGNAGTNLMYGESGLWHNNDDSLVGYQQDLRYADANSNSQATWTFSGLAAGTYRVSITFRAESNRANNVAFTLSGTGVASPTTGTLNQRVAPNQFQDGSAWWIDLSAAFGTISAGGSITVTLDALGSNGFVIADAVRLEYLYPLQAADGPATTPTATVLQAVDLNAVAAAAVARWQQTSLTAAQQLALNNITFAIADLPDAYLGSETSATIFVDSNAAGYGWYVDPTPADDAEFGRTLASTELGATDPLAAEHMDLLTVLMHEIGHRLGLDDVSVGDDAHGLMTESIDVGTRRLPAGAVALQGSTSPEGDPRDASDAQLDDATDDVFFNLGATDDSTPAPQTPPSLFGQAAERTPEQTSGRSTDATHGTSHHHPQQRIGGKSPEAVSAPRSFLGALFNLVRRRQK